MGGVLALALACSGLGLLAGWILRAPPAPPPGYVERLTHDLGLRPDQVALVDALLAELDAELDALIAESRRSMQGRVAERLEVTEVAILDVLDEGQRRRYEELLAAEGR